MVSYNEIENDFQTNYKYAHDFWAPYIQDARIASLASAGSTWTKEELKMLENEGREPLEFNIIRRPLQFYSGYLRDNLNSIVYSPIEGSDDKTATQLSKLSYYIWDKGEGYNTFLNACDSAFMSGLSLCGIMMDYSRDFINGDIKFYKRPFNSFYLDPTFENIDLSDCSFAILRDVLDKEIVKGLLPFINPSEIDSLQKSFKDDKFLSYHPNLSVFQRTRNLVAYDQYYERSSRKRQMLVDLENASYRDITDLSKEEKDKLKIGIKRIRDLRENYELYGMNPEDVPSPVEIRTTNVDYVKLNIMLNGRHVYSGEDKTGITRNFPFVPILGYFEPSIFDAQYRVQGIPATLYSTQRQFNKRHMKIIDMMDSTISTGYKYLIGSVPDVTDMQQSGQNKIIGVDPENAPEGLNSVQELHGGEANPTLIQYQQVLDQLTLTLANINESILGVDKEGNTQLSGRLAQVRIGQGLRNNRKMFDNIECSQRNLGKLILECIQTTYSPAKVKRILNEDPTEQFYDNQFEQYDATVKESVRSQSQRDAYYYELVNLKRDGIVDIPASSIIDALSIAGIDELKESIAKQEEAAQQQMQQKEQLEMKAIEKEFEEMDASKEEKLALAEERKGRTQSNLALSKERISESEQNRSQAALDRAKTISEIAKLKEDRILQVLDFVNSLQAEELTDRELTGADVKMQANKIDADVETESAQPISQEGAQMPIMPEQPQ